MADPFDRQRFAAAVKQKLTGISYRQAVEAFPVLNTTMLSRAIGGKRNLSIDSFLTICGTLRLRPMSFYNAGIKRRRVTLKTIVKQAVALRAARETEDHAHG